MSLMMIKDEVHFPGKPKTQGQSLKSSYPTASTEGRFLNVILSSRF
ncbi:hypothetical protein A2U01_0066635, partial [Trifolium medium]|nr:hypothetical protein [Trifolium medium]